MFRFCIGGINIKLGPSGIASRSLSVWLPLIQKNNFITVIMNKYYNSWYTNSLFSRSAMNKSGGKFEQLQALCSHWNKSVFTRRNSYPNNSYSNLLPYCTSVYTSFFFFFGIPTHYIRYFQIFCIQCFTHIMLISSKWLSINYCIYPTCSQRVLLFVFAWCSYASWILMVQR